jgi:hypothetical protein
VFVNVKMDVNGNAEGGKWKNLGSEVEKDGVRGRKRWGQRSKKMGSEVEKKGVRGRFF